MSKNQQSGKLKVIVRFRPLNQKELQLGNTTCIESIENNSIKLKQSSNLPSIMNTRFSFDTIFDQTATQKEVYNAVGKNILTSVFQGINGTIFAYGQTSSGKTYTCLGANVDEQQSRGIIPRLIQDIFYQIRSSPTCIQFRLKVSLVEIYMEKIRDLLDTNKIDLKIRQSKTRGIYIQNSTQIYVSSAQQLVKYVKIANGNRTLQQTFMNQASSRSHMVFILTLYQNNLFDISAKSAKLTLIDLAGSEKVGKTGAQGKLLDEAKQINKSLSALGNVINALTQAKTGHIPYRDSKLTRILQQSLGGNAKTNLIINCSPSQSNEWETISSLRFGFRAKNIKNKPKINRQYTIAQLLLLLQKSQRKIQQQQKLIKQLKMGRGLRVSDNNLLPDGDSYGTKQQIQSDQSDQNLLEDLNDLSVGYSLKSKGQMEYSEKKKKKHSENFQKLNLSTQFKEKNILEQQIKKLKKTIESQNDQKVKLWRTHQILKEKHEKLKVIYTDFKSKSNLLERQNLHLVQTSVQLQTDNKQLIERCKQLQDRINLYKEGLKSMFNQADFMKKQTEKFNIFGHNPEKIDTLQQLIKKTSIYTQTLLLNNSSKNQIQIKKNENNQQQLLIESKNDTQEKQNVNIQVFQQNRTNDQINKKNLRLKELQDKLSNLEKKRKALQQIINMQQNKKSKRILALQNYLVQLSTSFYVLKSQQYRWKTDTNINQNQLKRKTERITCLQKELLQKKQNFYKLKIKYDELAVSKSKDTDISDIDFGDIYPHQPTKYEANIVKILKSSSEKLNQLIWRKQQ